MELHKMKITIKSILVDIASISFLQSGYGQDAKQKKSIVIIVDGIPADLIESTNTPNIDEISAIGGYTRAYMGGERGGYSQTPTISAVCYTSMMTGTWGNKHNVWNNDLKDPNYNYWTFYRFMREANKDAKLAIFSTWLDNRTKLVGEGKVETNNFKFDIHFDGYEIDTLAFPHDKSSVYINKIDERVVAETSNSIRKDAPDFSWVYLQYTDDAGHRYGDGKGMIEAIEKADRQVGDIFNAVKYREQYFNEDWMVVVITDHGRDVATGYGHGGQSERERGIWISTNAKDINKHFKAHIPGIVDILPSLARHMDIYISDAQQKELDGVPFIGEVSIADPKAKIKDNILYLEWTPFQREGDVLVEISTTNTFKVGKMDNYVELGTYAMGKGKAEIKLPKSLQNNKFYKVTIKGKYNTLNRWIVVE